MIVFVAPDLLWLDYFALEPLKLNILAINPPNHERGKW